MGRRGWVLGIAVLALVVGGGVTWRVWPRDPGPVAPPVTAGELRQVNHHFHEGSVTYLGGGSNSQAHRLWSYYSHRKDQQGVEPRLLGISRVSLSAASPSDATASGVYWLVFSDRVYTPSYGTGGGGGFGYEAVLVPDDGKSISGNTMTF